MAFIKLSATERRRLSAFFTCLVLAFFAWAIAVLSNPRPYTAKVVLDFRNTPQRRAFHPLQSDTIPVTVDLHTLENKSYLVLSAQKDQINSRREGDKQIISFTPDTLYFDFSNRKVKRIPVNLITSIKYKRQFFQSGNITLNPAYVIINGPSNL